MPYMLNRKLAKLEPYQPIEGEYRIRLDANESFIDINDILSEEIKKEVSNIQLNRYPDPYANGTVQAFADYYGIPAKYVTAGNGSDELISIITSCFLDKDSKIMTFSPDFSMYAFYGSMYELNVETLVKGLDLKINVSQAIDFCSDNDVKAILFSNPCNPTSLGLSREDVRTLIKNVNALVILDEAYMDFWNESLLSEEDIKEYDNLIILKTCSKAIGLAGIRLGFAIANEKLTSALRAAKSPYNTDSISQAIGRCVLSHKDLINENISLIKQSATGLYKALTEICAKYDVIENVYKTVTNFVFVKTRSAQQLYIMMLKHGIAIRKLGGYLRITAGTAEENKEFIKTFEEVIYDLEGVES